MWTIRLKLSYRLLFAAGKHLPQKHRFPKGGSSSRVTGTIAVYCMKCIRDNTGVLSASFRRGSLWLRVCGSN